MHTDRTRTTKRRGTTTASVRYAWGGWGRSAQRGRSERGTGDRTGTFRMRKTGKRLMLRALHLTTFSGSGIQFLVILCIPSIKDFFFCPCRARSRLRRSSKRVVFVSQFPPVGEEVRAKSQVSFKAKTNNTTKNQNPTITKTSNPGRHPEN